MYSGKKGKQDLFGKVNSIYLQGMWGTQVSVEADVSGGLPGWSFVGYLASEVREAQDRVRTAIRNLGVELPPRKVTINLSPADLRKEGTGFDLAIVAAIRPDQGDPGSPYPYGPGPGAGVYAAVPARGESGGGVHDPGDWPGGSWGS